MPGTPERSKSVDALYRNALTVWPGMTIYWIGDLAHQGEVSGHNPDDYPPLQAELTDADNLPEVRALDFMLGPKFTVADAQRLVIALTQSLDKGRTYYVIYNRRIYRKATGFKPEGYSGGDPHTDHVHFSGLAADDANGSDWRSVLALGEEEYKDMATLYKTPVGFFVSNGVNRRGPVRTSGSVFGPATQGMPTVELTEAMRTLAGNTSWDSYLDDVAGPLHPATSAVDLTAVARAVNDEHARRMTS